MQRPARPLRLRRMARRRCSRHEDSRSSGGQPGTRATRRATTPRFAAIMRYLPDSKTSANRCFLGAGSETAWGQRATKGRQMEARRVDDLMRRPPPRRDGSTWAAGVNVGQPRVRNRCTRIVSRSPRCTRDVVWCPTPSANMLRTASFRRGRDGAGFQRCRVVIDPGMNHEQVSGWSASCSDGPVNAGSQAATDRPRSASSGRANWPNVCSSRSADAGSIPSALSAALDPSSGYSTNMRPGPDRRRFGLIAVGNQDPEP